MSNSKLAYVKTAERPDIQLWLRDADGNLIDLTGYTFVFKVGHLGQAAALTKSSGITGAAGSGVEGAGTPNVTIQFGAGEWDSIAADLAYRWQLRATSGGVDRVYQGPFALSDVIT